MHGKTYQENKHVELAALAERNMTLTCTVQDGQIWFSAGDITLGITLRQIFPA